MSVVELAEGRPGRVALVRETEDSDVKPGVVAAGGGRKGKRTEYRCATCGYGIVVYERPRSCPMCSKPRWEHVRPRSRSATFAQVKLEHRSKMTPKEELAQLGSAL